MTTKRIHLRPDLLATARIYAESIAEVATKLKMTAEEIPHALTETDAYPRLQKQPEIEFQIGWLRGVADMLGVDVEKLWDHLVDDAVGRRRAQLLASLRTSPAVPRAHSGKRRAA
jgi:hypothetical protein